MASRRFYAYYIRGSQLALVEHDSVSGDGQTLGQPSLDDIGPSGGLQWKSPIASITDGIEIEYAYSPSSGISSDLGYGILGRTKLASSGWFIDRDGYVNFLTVSETLAADFISAQSGAYGEVLSAVAGTKGNTLRITDSERWNGVHKIQDRSARGFIQTYTKSSSSYDTGELSSTVADVALHSDGYLYGTDGNDVWVNLALSSGDFVWISQATSGDNGLYKVTSITETDAGAESTQKAYLGTKYFLGPEDEITEFQSGDEHIASYTSNMIARKVKYSPSYINAETRILQDESDTIDLPEYLAKGLVYYVKAKVAEDQGDIEQKEYNMREFRRILEKHESSKIRGPRMMIPGGHGIR